MLFSIVVALMVILLTAFWVYQGLLSALLMFFASAAACMLAFGYYESVHSFWSDQLGPGIGLPVAFMLLFLMSLLVLRLFFDKLVPNNVRLPVYVDRTGGGICGFFIGLTIVGTALVGVQMLPIGSDVFGFERFQTEGGRVTRESFLFKPDDFVSGFSRMLSGKRFGGDAELTTAKPDLLAGLYSARANPQPQELMFVPPEAIQVKAYWDATQIDDVSQRVAGDGLEREFSTAGPANPVNKFVVCRVRLDASAAKNLADLRFRLPQFRIVGPPPEPNGGGASPRVYLAVGMSDVYTHKDLGPKAVERDQYARLVRFGPTTNFHLGPSNCGPAGEKRGREGLEVVGAFQFDVAFEVPADFRPWYVEFKHGARAELTSGLFRERPPQGASVAGGRVASAGESSNRQSKKRPRPDKPDGPKVGQASAGSVHVADAIEEGTGVSSKLPFPLDPTESVVSRVIRGGKLDESTFWLELPEGKIDDPVTEFHVPPGKKMVQIAASKKDALSLFGKALNFAANVAAQIRVTTASGDNYYAQGVYAAAPIGGKMVFEIQYWPNTDVPERCLKAPVRVTKNVLGGAPSDRRAYGYVFLVDPGVKLVKFHAGSRFDVGQDLNIDVPN
jgi:hypothetical protein